MSELCNGKFVDPDGKHWLSKCLHERSVFPPMEYLKVVNEEIVCDPDYLESDDLRPVDADEDGLYICELGHLHNGNKGENHGYV